MAHEPIETLLETHAPTLRDDERALVWQGVVKKLPTTAVPVVSPYREFVRLYLMHPAVLTFMCIIAVTSGSSAINASVPGDILFPLELEVESVRLSLSSDSNRESLATTFAEERINEMYAIFDAEAVLYDDVAALTPQVAEPSGLALTMTEQAPAFRITEADTAMMKEAVVPSAPALQVAVTTYSDVSVVYVTQSGATSRFVTPARTKESIVVEAATLFGATVEDVSTAMNLTTVNRPSRPAERGEVIATPKGQTRAMAAVTALLDQLAATESEPVRQALAEAVLREVQGLSVLPTSSQAGVEMSTFVPTDPRIEMNGDTYVIVVDGKTYGTVSKAP